MQRDRGLERIADHVVEVEAGEPLGVGEAVGVDDDERAELLGLLPERRVVRLRQLACPPTLVRISTPFMPSDFTQRSSSLAASSPSDQRHGAERDEAVGLARHVFREAVVDHARGLHRDVERHRVVALVRRRHHDLQVDAHGVEVGEALVIAGDARADVLFLLLAQRLGLGIGEMRQRDRRHVEMGLDEGAALRDRDVGMDVDGGALRPDLAARLAVLARRRRLVLVPLRRPLSAPFPHCR